MTNFFHSLGIGIVSTFIAFTGLFHSAPVDVSHAPTSQVIVATTSSVESTSTVVTSIIKKTTQDVTEKSNISKTPVIVENKTNQNVLVDIRKETTPNNPPVVQSSAVLPVQQPPVVQKDVDKGIPYQGGDGNWYYPKAYDANGRNLQAPVVTIANSETPILNLATTTDGQYFAVPIKVFQIMGKNSDSILGKLAVHLTTTGDVKITKVFLYREGNNTPLANSTVDNNGLATFTISDATKDNKFGADIPTQFTVKANLTNAMTTTINCRSVQDVDAIQGQLTIRGSVTNFERKGVSSFGIKSIIKITDIDLYDDSNNTVKVIGSALENTINYKSNVCNIN